MHAKKIYYSLHFKGIGRGTNRSFFSFSKLSFALLSSQPTFFITFSIQSLYLQLKEKKENPTKNHTTSNQHHESTSVTCVQCLRYDDIEPKD
jgi:hypothetical protein